jgi:hypothetical protein
LDPERVVSPILNIRVTVHDAPVGLHESHVDSDEEDLAESIGSFTLRDTVRDCLEKDPADRTEEDIEVFMDSFLQC